MIGQIREMARRSILQTLRQPAMVIPPVVFPLLLVSINAAGLSAATKIPGFPADSYWDFAIAVPFMQGSLFACINAGASLARDVESARARVIASRSNKDEVAVLEQDVKNAQMVYDQMAARKSQLDLLSESGQSNVSILTRASAGDDPIWPRPKILVFGGALLGGLISALGILLIEALDRRIRNRAELESWLGIPDLGQVRNSGHFFLETPLARRGSLPKPQHARLGSQG